MITIRLPKQLEDRLNALAANTNRTKTFYAREAIMHYIEDWEDGEEALKRLRDPNQILLTTEELLASFEDEENNV